MSRFIILPPFEKYNPMDLRRSRRGPKHGLSGLTASSQMRYMFRIWKMNPNTTLAINFSYLQEPGLILVPRSIR